MEPIRVLRLISRLNVGGPAIQAITLTRLLEDRGYATTLVRGIEGEREGNMDPLAADLGVEPLRLRALRRELGPHDARALGGVLRVMLRFRPHVLHTHAAKAGTVGRAAALLAGPRAPAVRVHTFHGHVLEGYFSPRKAAAFAGLERFLARHTSRVVAVSDEVREDLVRLRIAPPGRIAVLPLGFDLDRFSPDRASAGEERAAVRAELDVADDVPLVTMIARLVPIKRVDRFLRVAARVAAQDGRAVFAVVGDGELAGELRAGAEAAELERAGRLRWVGFRRDVEALYAASELVVQTSDNEGTPVSLIEAHASARAVVSTRVGGVASVVLDGESGLLAPAGDEDGLAAAIVELLADPGRRREMGEAGRRHVRSRFSIDRLVDDVDALYRSLLQEASATCAG